VRACILKFVNMLPYRAVGGISLNLRLSCTWGQRWNG